MSLTGDNKTDVVNKALLVWDLIQTTQHSGGGILIKDRFADDLPATRTRFF